MKTLLKEADTFFLYNTKMLFIAFQPISNYLFISFLLS